MASMAGSKGGQCKKFVKQNGYSNDNYLGKIEEERFKQNLYEYVKDPYKIGDVCSVAKVSGLGNIVKSEGGLKGLRDLYEVGAEPISARDLAYAMVNSPVLSPTSLLDALVFNESVVPSSNKGGVLIKNSNLTTGRKISTT